MRGAACQPGKRRPYSRRPGLAHPAATRRLRPRRAPSPPRDFARGGGARQMPSVAPASPAAPARPRARAGPRQPLLVLQFPIARFLLGGAIGRLATMVAPTCSCVSEVQVANEAARTIDAASQLLAGHLRRREAREHAADYLRGLLADVERKNGWQLAEQAGYAHPRGIQRVLDRYTWDADAIRDALRQWVVAELGDPQGILVVDETSFPKQGQQSVGVARQYCGTLGKLANCQVGVFLGYATPRGHVGLDRALFVPEEWFADRDRCRQAGIPEHVTHRTKPQLARELLERALDGGVPAAWVAGDEVYGSDGKLRRALEERGQAYVLAVRSNEKPTTWPP